MRKAVFVLLITSFVLCGCSSMLWPLSQPPKKTILEADRVELPTTFINGRPYVDLKINGKGPYLFLVDTGAAYMTLTPRVSSEAQVWPMPTKAKVMGASGSFEDEPIIIIDRIEAPLFSLREIRATTCSPETARLLETKNNRVGGLIGMGTLKNLLLEIDYPQQKVSVAKIGSATPSINSGLHYTGFGPYAAGQLRVKIATASTKHATTTVLVDTGMEAGFCFTDIASYPMRAGLTKNDFYLGGIGGHWRSRHGQMAGDIRLGSAIWHDPRLQEANLDLIGSDALATCRLMIDPQKKMLWVEGGENVPAETWVGPLEPDGRPSVYGFAMLPEGDAWIVKEVDMGSRAERVGLKVGDRVTSLETTDPSSTGQRPGTYPNQIRMRILRGSVELEINMSLLERLSEIVKPTVTAP